MLVGLISDTHGFFDPRLRQDFAGVTRILHAGDIGNPRVIDELLGLAPVTAVLGNNDSGADYNYKSTELIEVADRRILIHHIVLPQRASKSIGPRFEASRPQIVVFGHTHQPYRGIHDGTLFINPGYSGNPRFGLERGVAILDLGKANAEVRFISWK